jgi:hypothetical protein
LDVVANGRRAISSGDIGMERPATRCGATTGLRFAVGVAQPAAGGGPTGLDRCYACAATMTNSPGTA